VIQQQRQLGFRPVRPHRLQIGEVLLVQRDDMVEAVKILPRHLSGRAERDVDPVALRHRGSARIGRIAEVPIARPAESTSTSEPDPLDFSPQRRLGQRRRQILPKHTNRTDCDTALSPAAQLAKAAASASHASYREQWRAS
jgi:hypothetical protein